MHPQFKPPPGWPTIDEAEGPFVRPAWSPPRNADGRLMPGPAPDAFMDTPNGPVGLYAHPPRQAIPDTFAPPPARTGMDPVTQRILAAGAVAPLFGWGGSLFFGAMAGATTALAYLAACLAAAWLMRNSGGGSGKVSVSVKVDNRSYGGRR